LNRSTKKERTKRVIAIKSITSLFDIVRIFPQIKFNASVFGPAINPIPRKATPKIKEKIIPTETLGSMSALSAIGPISNAEARQNKSAIVRGSICNRSPNIAPAKAAWDIATPTNGIRIIITQTPTMPQLIPPKIEARIARCMNPY